MNEQDSVPVKLNLQKQAVGQICPVSQSSLTCDLKQCLRKLESKRMGKDQTGKFKFEKWESRYECQTRLNSRQKASIELHFLMIKCDSLVVMNLIHQIIQL